MNNYTPLVSIIIPIFNRGKLIGETLETLLKQTHENWECIIVDDGSTDNTLDILQDYAIRDCRFKVLSRPMNLLKGANSCRNFGFRVSLGRYIQWFDSDDIMFPEMLMMKLKNIVENNADIVICRSSFFNEKGDDIEVNRDTVGPKTNNPPLEYFAGGFWFQTAQPLFSRIYIENLDGLFNENLKRHQETEFFVRILLGNPKVIYLEETLQAVRLHSLSIGGSYNSFKTEDRFVLDWQAYKCIFMGFNNTDYLDKDSLIYFQDFFFRCLRLMRYDFKEMLSLFKFGIKYNLFPSNFLAFKYYFYRSFKFIISNK